MSVNWRTKVGITLMLAAVLGGFVAFTQMYSGYGFKSKVSIESSARISADQRTYRWKMLRTTQLSSAQEIHSVVLEDGKPIGKRAPKLHVTQTRGWGWYFVRDSIVRFAPVDGSDPRTNGRHYELEYPTEVRMKIWWLLGGLFLGGWFLAGVHHKTELGDHLHFPRLEKAMPWLLLGIFIIIKLSFLYTRPAYDDGVFSLNGLPSSDAAGWHDNAGDLARGLGYHEDRRPGYMYLLGGIYQLFGASVKVALISNAFLQGVAAAVVFLIGARLGSRILGLSAAVYLLFADETLKLALVILTENAGLTFGALALLTFLMTLQKRSAMAAFLSGLLVGVGNLSACIFLLTVPFYPLLLTLVAWREAWNWKQWMKIAATFTIAVCLIFVPWIIRQKLVFGLATFTPNTAELLYGGAHPEEGRMTRKLYLEAEQADYMKEGSSAGYKYFMDKYTALVSEDPIRYVKQIGAAFIEGMNSLPRKETAWGWMTVCGIFAMALSECWHRKSLLPLIPGIAFLLATPYVDQFPASYVMIVAFLILMLSCTKPLRRDWLGVLLTFLAVLVLCAFIGNIITKRFFAASSWLPFLLWIGAWRAALYHSTEWLTALCNKVFNQHSRGADDISSTSTSLMDGFTIRTGWATLTIFALAFLSTSVASAWHNSNPRSPVTLSQETKSQLSQDIITQHPDQRIRTLSPADLELNIVVLDDRQAFIKADEDTNSMTRIGEVRPYNRWIGEASRVDLPIPYHRVTSYQAAGPLPEVPLHQPVIMVGICNPGDMETFGNNIDLFEVVACYTTQVKDAVVTPLQPIWFSPSGEFLNNLADSTQTPAAPE